MKKLEILEKAFHVWHRDSSEELRTIYAAVASEAKAIYFKSGDFEYTDLRSRRNKPFDIVSFQGKGQRRHEVEYK